MNKLTFRVWKTKIVCLWDDSTRAKKNNAKARKLNIDEKIIKSRSWNKIASNIDFILKCISVWIG